MSRITLNLKKFSRADEHTGDIRPLSWVVASRIVPQIVKGSGRDDGGGYNTYGFGGTPTGTTASGRWGVPDTELISATAFTDAMESATLTIEGRKVQLNEE
ncbi:hypothetical protein AAF712_011543 [Marasmius tenuissimus]|uniref:Uncharacterized protein n=1 Tax=Marasmius tenuissimus TaxID=585030 RepID=A0ABR2ZIY5_9AGAR